MFFRFRYLHSPKVYLRALRIKLRSVGIDKAKPLLTASRTLAVTTVLPLAGFAGAVEMIGIGEHAAAVFILIVGVVTLAISINSLPGIPAHPLRTKSLKVIWCLAALVFTSYFLVLAYTKAQDSSWSTLLPRDNVTIPVISISTPAPVQTTLNASTIMIVMPTSSEAPSAPNPRPTKVQRKKRGCKWEDTILGKCV